MFKLSESYIEKNNLKEIENEGQLTSRTDHIETQPDGQEVIADFHSSINCAKDKEDQPETNPTNTPEKSQDQPQATKTPPRNADVERADDASRRTLNE